MIIKAIYDITTNKIHLCLRKARADAGSSGLLQLNEFRRQYAVVGYWGSVCFVQEAISERKKKYRLSIFFFLPFYSIPWGLFSLGPWKSTFPLQIQPDVAQEVVDLQ